MNEDCSELTDEQIELIKGRLKLESGGEVLIISTPSETKVLRGFSNTDINTEVNEEDGDLK